MVVHPAQGLIHTDGVFIRDRKDYQTLLLVMRVNQVKVLHLLAAGSTLRRPEADQDDLAAKRRKRRRSGSTANSPGGRTPGYVVGRVHQIRLKLHRSEERRVGKEC